MMDWPVIGTVSATILVAGALTFEVVVFMQPDPAPFRPLPRLPTLVEPDPIPQSASPLPRLSRLIEPDPIPQGKSPTPADPEPAPPPPQTASIASVLAKSSPSG